MLLLAESNSLSIFYWWGNQIQTKLLISNEPLLLLSVRCRKWVFPLISLAPNPFSITFVSTFNSNLLSILAPDGSSILTQIKLMISTSVQFSKWSIFQYKFLADLGIRSPRANFISENNFSILGRIWWGIRSEVRVTYLTNCHAKVELFYPNQI